MRRALPCALLAVLATFEAGCRGCAPGGGPPRGDTAVVQDFEGRPEVHKWPRGAAGAVEVSSAWCADGQRSLRIDPGLMASLTELSAHDFTGYATLAFHVHNPAAETAAVGLELQDDHTAMRDRHQRTVGVPPGDERVEIDIAGSLWRGEENRPYRGEVKAPLDVSRITRIAFTNRGREAIYIDRITIERGPSLAAKGAFAFDFGPTGSQVMGQTLGVFEATRYTPERGYGLLGDHAEALGRSMSYPTPLLGDGLGLDDAGFRVDLEGGAYLGWVAFERGGFWEGESSGYRRAALAVNGQVAASHDFSESGPHFFFEDTELTSLAEIEERLVRPAAAVQRFAFTARPGGNVFTLAVEGRRGARLRIAGLVLAPDTPEGRAFLDAHEALQSRATRAAFTPWDRGRRGAGRAPPEQELLVEPLPPGAQVYPRDYPAHPRGAPLGEILAVAGQPVTVQLAVHAQREMRVHVEATLAGAAGPPRVSVGRYLPMRGDAPGPVWLEVNHYRPEPDFTVGPELTRAVVVELPTPDHGSGELAGAITLAAEGARVEVPVRVRLVDRPLPEIPIPVGLFMNALPFDARAVGEATWQRFQEDLLREQARAGLTCLTGGPGIAHPLGREPGAVDTAEAYIALARRFGPVRAVVPYGGFLPPLKTRAATPEQLAAALPAYAAPHYAYAYDEPATDAEIAEARALVAPFTAAGVRTMGFTSTSRASPALDALLGSTYAPALAEHTAGDIARLRAEGRHVWIYGNGLSRYGMGLHLWRGIKLGAEGRLEWIGLFTQGFAFDNLDGREASPSSWVVHDRLGPMPTPRWLAAREGLLDLRVRLALEATVPPGDPSLAAWPLDGYRADHERWTDEALAAARAAMLERLGRSP